MFISIRSAYTQTFPGIRRVNFIADEYMLTGYEEELYIFLISRGVPEYKYAKYYLTQH